MTAPGWDGSPAWIVEQVKNILRLPDQDPDLERIAQLAAAVIDLTARYLDLPDGVLMDPPIPPAIGESCVIATVEYYKRKDAPFGIVGAWSGDTIPMRVSRDVLDPVKAALQPYVAAWGFA